MNKKIIKLLIVCYALVLLNGCKKDYIIGGTLEDTNMYKNMSTYDYLANNVIYDTLIKIVDAAGLKDKINEQGVTFFAPSNQSIKNYLNLRYLDAYNANHNTSFGFDSLLYYVKNNVNKTRDSLSMYLIHQPLTYSVLTNTGAFYKTELAGDSAIISYEYTKDPNFGYNPLISKIPQIVYYTHLWYSYDLSDNNPASNITPDIGIHTLVKTSNIETQTGIVEGLDNSHNLFFYGTKQ